MKDSNTVKAPISVSAKKTSRFHISPGVGKSLVAILLLLLFMAMVSAVRDLDSGFNYFGRFKNLVEAVSTTEWVGNFASYIQIPDIPYYEGFASGFVNSLSGVVNFLSGIINAITYIVQFILNIVLYVINMITMVFRNIF